MNHSVNLNKATEQIFKRIDKIRKYGWFSKDVQEMLLKKYGEEKKILLTELTDKQKERDKIEEQIKKIARRINKCQQ